MLHIKEKSPFREIFVINPRFVATFTENVYQSFLFLKFEERNFIIFYTKFFSTFSFKLRVYVFKQLSNNINIH